MEEQSTTCEVITDPTFKAIVDELNKVQNGRERRVQIIEELERLLDGKFIIYISSFKHPFANINRDDIIPLEDILKSVGYSDKLFLLLDSPGGDPDAAEKIIKMCRNYCKEFNVIVPNCAKSAATLISLGADNIYMGHLSELGPIDPQITYKLPNGQYVTHPAQSIIDSFNKIEKSTADKGQLSQAHIPILNNIDIALIDYAEKARKRAQQLAELWLQGHMLKDDHETASEIAEILSDANKHLSHGRVIDAKEASDMGLKTTFLDKDTHEWNLIWELYCRLDFFMRNTKRIKVYESSTSSLGLGVSE